RRVLALLAAELLQLQPVGAARFLLRPVVPGAADTAFEPDVFSHVSCQSLVASCQLPSVSCSLQLTTGNWQLSTEESSSRRPSRRSGRPRGWRSGGFPPWRWASRPSARRSS